jgi:3-oxoacyl-[acyl-carrier-protein] synthase-3
MDCLRRDVAINIDRYANTTAGTIPIYLSKAVDSKQIRKNDNILMASFGAGFTWGKPAAALEI